MKINSTGGNSCLWGSHRKVAVDCCYMMYKWVISLGDVTVFCHARKDSKKAARNHKTDLDILY